MVVGGRGGYSKGPGMVCEALGVNTKCCATTLRVEYEYAYYFSVGKLNIISHSAGGGKKI